MLTIGPGEETLRREVVGDGVDFTDATSATFRLHGVRSSTLIEWTATIDSQTATNCWVSYSPTQEERAALGAGTAKGHVLIVVGPNTYESEQFQIVIRNEF